jgi:CRP-like cAMP-binding protein
MSTMTSDTTRLHLAPREVFAPDAPQQLWRVANGALRIDSAPPGEARRFVRLALPGDVIGVEQWAGTNDHLSLRALIDTGLTQVDATGPQMMQILMETVVVAHQRCREVVTLRSGPVAQRIQAMLLMFAQGRRSGNGSVVDCPVPYLADLSDIVDAAPETVSRVLGSMREHDFLQDRKPQKARFSSQALKGLEMVAGMSAVRSSRRLQAAGI